MHSPFLQWTYSANYNTVQALAHPSVSKLHRKYGVMQFMYSTMSVSSMSNQKTLFVVGAGASSEVGLPIGYELKDTIIKNLAFTGNIQRGDNVIYDALNVTVGRSPVAINGYFQSCKKICEGMSQVISIDNYLDLHSDDAQIQLCGKLAIVRAILDAESRSTMFINPSNINNKMDFKSLEKSWYSSFWKLLTENCSRSKLDERFESIAFVVFNYDRCIEHYLYHSLMNIYHMSDSDAAMLVNKLEIFHPYGTVGSLPWQNTAESIQFGDTPNANQLLRLAQQIRTFTEGTNEKSSDVPSIRSHMMTSYRIVFLGFAFHRLNMQLLVSNKNLKPVAQYIYGTNFKDSDDNTSSIHEELMGIYKQVTPKLRNDLRCNDLFHEFRRRLSFV